MLQGDNRRAEILDSPSNVPESDPLSEKETFRFASQKNEHKRREKVLDFFNFIILITAGFVSLLFLLVLICISVHFMAPVEYHWLSDAQLKTLITILSSGIVSMLASTFLNNYFRKV